MYFRRKTSAGRAYLQIVESRREGTGRPNDQGFDAEPAAKAAGAHGGRDYDCSIANVTTLTGSYWPSKKLGGKLHPSSMNAIVENPIDVMKPSRY